LDYYVVDIILLHTGLTIVVQLLQAKRHLSPNVHTVSRSITP